MPKIIMPEPSDKDQNDGEHVLEVTYQATEQDEECFFLIYHLQMAPSEARALDGEYRRWLIGRFIVQKEQEQAAFEQHRIAEAIMPNLKV